MKSFVKVVIKDGGKILKHHFLRADGWDIPAGKIEEGETPREAAIRELVERTGFSIASDKLNQRDDQGEFYVFEGHKSDLIKVGEPGEKGGYSTEIRWE